jgi:hypothetical protein
MNFTASHRNFNYFVNHLPICQILAENGYTFPYPKINYSIHNIHILRHNSHKIVVPFLLYGSSKTEYIVLWLFFTRIVAVPHVRWQRIHGIF